MKSARAIRFLFALLFVLFVSNARAHEPAAASGSGLKAELLAELTSVEKTIVRLAEAMPAEKFGWRPAEGVRSVGEVYVHIAVGNYMLPSLLGAKRPEGTRQEMEKTVTEKANVIEEIKKSFENARKAVESMPAADYEKKVDFFGKEKTVRSVLLLLVTHAHEHLGQSIAYARMNGVTPPWSAAEEKPQPKREKG